MIGPTRQIVIIGGGLSGLSAAFYIRKYYKEAGYKPEIVLYEKGKTLGGKIETLHRDGFVIEKGPDSFQAQKSELLNLIAELELDHELVYNNLLAEKTYLLQRDQLYPMPEGLVYGVPTQWLPFLTTPLVSWGGKLRVMLDYILPPRRSREDMALGDLIERRLGPEVLENLVEPLLTGIYAGDAHQMSLQATYPQMGEIERRHGSLVRGLRRRRKIMNTDTGIHKSGSVTLRNGLQSLIHGLIYELHDVEQRTKSEVVSIHPTGRTSPRYEVELQSGERQPADDVFIATPGYAAADLLRPHMDVTALEAVDYISVATLVMAFLQKDFAIDYDGSGFLVPRKEGRNITACSWTSNKWPHTSPEDHVLLCCYVGRKGDEQNVQLPDEALTELVRKDLREILGISAKPIFTEITRMEQSMPQYPVGHLDNMSRLRKELKTSLPGVYVFGDGDDGVGMLNGIKQAKMAAENAAMKLMN